MSVCTAEEYVLCKYVLCTMYSGVYSFCPISTLNLSILLILFTFIPLYLYPVWCMVYGIWYLVYGVWYMVFGVWYVLLDEKTIGFPDSRFSHSHIL
jgi:hypothetical protein